MGAVAGPRPEQHRLLAVLWRSAGVTERADRLALTSAVVGRTIGSSSELTPVEADTLIGYMQQLDADGALAGHAAAWLAAHPQNRCVWTGLRRHKTRTEAQERDEDGRAHRCRLCGSWHPGKAPRRRQPASLGPADEAAS